MTRDRSFWNALAVSAGIHVAVVGGAAGLVSLLEATAEPEELTLEFSIAPPAVAPPVKKTARKTAKKWNLAKEGQKTAEVPDDAAPEEETPECADCIPGENEFVPLSQARRGPRWKSGFITREDYPPEALKKGFEGKVKVMVYVSREGRVQDVRLLEGSHRSLNKVVIRKLKRAIFDPGRDENGRPIPVKMILPIKFHLRR